MPVKLRVSNAVDAEAPDEYFFEQDRVEIGRASDNHLTLPDPQRIVSKQHAEIRNEGGTYQLVDRGSKNFTFLDGKRLEAGRAYPLQSGDLIEIGDFEITFEVIEKHEPTGEETIFAPSFSNPFEEPAAELMRALNEIVEAYEDEVPNRRLDGLRHAFKQAEDEVAAEHEALALVGQLIGLNDQAAPAEGARSAQKQKATSKKTTSKSRERERRDRGTGGRREALFEILLEAVARTIRIPWQFRHEFIGQTIVQSSDREALYEGDAEALESYLMAPSLSDEEIEERFQALREAVDKLVVHQVAMLDGYKAGVRKGAQQLLDDMNPEAKEAEVREENQLYDLLPILGRSAVLAQLQETYQELQGEDWSVAERWIFRPAFIKAYLARMTASAASSDEE